MLNKILNERESLSQENYIFQQVVKSPRKPQLSQSACYFRQILLKLQLALP